MTVDFFPIDTMAAFLTVIVVDDEVNSNFDNDLKRMDSKRRDNSYVKMLTKYR